MPTIAGTTPTVIVTLDPATGALRAELPSPAGRRKLDIKPGTLEATLLTVLEGMSVKRYAIGEDGAPTQSQVQHWERHTIWSDPQCPHCIGEGRFAKSGKQRNRRITKADAAALALRARGYVERAPGRWYKLGFETTFVTRTGVVSSPNRRWPAHEVVRLREEGQREANLRQYTSPCFRPIATLNDGTVVRHAPTTKTQRAAALDAKIASIEITF
jgi:hypothetical protein